MATETQTRAQDIITCDLCTKPVQQFCNSCQVSLCEDCINKHVKSLKTMKHDIVPFLKRTVRLVFPKCTSHSQERCEAHCQQCDVPVCIKCLLGPIHKGHDIVDMADIIATKRENIKKETEEIEGTIAKTETQDANAENKISKTTIHFALLGKQAREQRNQWHKEVDNIFDKLESLIQSLRDHQITTLKFFQSQLRQQNSTLIKTIQENEEILKSNEAFDVINYKSKMTELRNISQMPDLVQPSLKINNFNIQGTEISIELEEYKAILKQTSLSSLTDEVSTLSVMELLEEPRVIASFPTNVCKKLCKVACVGSNKAWIWGLDKVITCVDINGSVLDTITTTCKTFPNGMRVNRLGELIYSDGIHGTVNIVRGGKIETLITTPKDWHPNGLCSTRSGDILLCMFFADKSHFKIVRYQGQEVTQEIDEDEHGTKIFKGGRNGLNAVENYNEDIVACDGNADTVVGLDKTGKVRFRYNDKPPGGAHPFCPTQIVTDCQGHVIVVDYHNNCLHILDQNGQFLRYLDNCGLDGPFGLSSDNEGRLWVGLFDSRKMKVIHYLR